MTVMQTDREVLEACEGVLLLLRAGERLTPFAIDSMLTLVRARLAAPPAPPSPASTHR